MTPFSCVLIGNESLVIGCAETLLERGHRLAAVVSEDPGVRDWARGKGLVLLADAAEIAGPGVGGAFDWLFSIANLKMIPEALLTLPARGAINFHDGPLPAYAGLNTPVWALLNGEARHGITWHMIETGIDTGDIVESADFDISGDETAFSLNSKCYGAAMDSFARLVGQIERGEVTRRPQDLSQRRYFARADRPAAAGRLDFTGSAERICAVVRALDFGGYWNPLSCPKIESAGQVLLVGRATVTAGAAQATPGTVLSADGDGLLVATGTGPVRLEQLRNTAGAPLDVARLAPVGTLLASPDADDSRRLGAAIATAIRGEAFWRRALRAMDPVELPLAGAERGAPAWETHVLDLAPDAPAADRVPAVLAWALLGSGQDHAGIALSDAAMAEAAASAPGYVSGWVPLAASRPQDTARVAEEVARARRLGGFAADLLARDPALSGTRVPAIGLTFDDAPPVPGTALTVALREGAAPVLHVDRARLSAEAVTLLARRLAGILDSGSAALPAAERHDLLANRNRSACALDRTQTLHHAFESQVARAPDATALIFENRALSYRELNGRANAMARRLVALGVRPGAHVGLFLRRTPDLVIAALAVLKAGGAYVPLDPAYPADRIAHFVSDSTASVIVSQGALCGSLPASSARILDADDVTDMLEDNVDGGATAADLAYLIYTSGSTGTPKGVMVEHRNVINFCAGMDQRIARSDGAVWLAVTSLSFDISVLELFYTLARGYTVVLAGDDNRAAVSNGPIGVSDARMDFNLFYWGNDDGPGPKKYELLLEGAKFADANGFNAVWTPERHFHAFGGPYPNPSVTGAAVAAVTKNLSVRAGSCVAPLHHPARIAEEWAVIDNLTGGRAGLAIASGWQPDDFVLRPENTPPANKAAMFDAIDKLRRLWRGEAVAFPTQKGDMFDVITQPRPVSSELPVWVTTAGNPDTWREAGSIGANVLTHLLGQSIDEVGDKIRIYHAALRGAGHDPADFTVTLMLHTYLADSRDTARSVAREPMKDYLRSAAGLIKQYAWAFPAFKRPAGVTNPFEVDLAGLGTDEMEAILDFAFERYFEDSGLFGTVDDALARTEQLKRIGVTEIACLIDYGIAPAVVLEGLKPLAEVLRRANAPTALAGDDFSLAAQILRHNVTHLQCTPSMARIIAMNDEARMALRRVRHLMLGGEALPGDLVRDLRGCTSASIQNMYGPTETTIWSTSGLLGEQVPGVAPIGAPIANTAVYVLDEALEPVATGVTGELWIGGEGVTRGYWKRPELTAERFRPDPFATEAGLAVTDAPRMYRTGDLVCWRPDGTMDFLGRADHQVKIRGQRIELGEIESCLGGFAGITGAVVVARDHGAGDTRLAAYVTTSAALSEPALRAHLARNLPEVMVPADIVTLDRFPLTPNKKIDRKALPEPVEQRAPAPVDAAPPSEGIEAGIAAIWSRVLGLRGIRATDNFFALGGHSLLAVQAHREIRDTLDLPQLSITDIFRFPTLSGLAAHIGKDRAPAAPEPVVTAPERVETMSRRRAMRARRHERAG